MLEAREPVVLAQVVALTAAGVVLVLEALVQELRLHRGTATPKQLT